MTTTTSSQVWVVIASETYEGETTTQIVSDEYASEAEADEVACDMQYRNPSLDVEVTTLELALALVTD